MRLCAKVSTGICACCIFVEPAITAFANAGRGDQPPRDLGPQDGQASGKGRAVVAGVPGDRLQELAQRQLGSPSSMMSPGST